MLHSTYTRKAGHGYIRIQDRQHETTRNGVHVQKRTNFHCLHRAGIMAVQYVALHGSNADYDESNQSTTVLETVSPYVQWKGSRHVQLFASNFKSERTQVSTPQSWILIPHPQPRGPPRVQYLQINQLDSSIRLLDSLKRYHDTCLPVKDKRCSSARDSTSLTI